ncbi:M64 family metallopeptidase [Kitasatospora purpeofusca]|uniref:M64 family metallopeptidase n=1 Tax=Kitasatospora purpeofusca TaxID=67352 RepID=UPI003647A180
MSSRDYVVGRPDKVSSGWTVAIVSEGYTQAELDDGLFERDAAKVAVRLLNTPPFNHRDLRPLLVVVKVRIASVNTGNTIVPRFPVPAVSPFRTAFGAMFNRSLTSSHQPMERAIHGDNAAVKDLVHGQPGLASVQHFLVIVNNDRTDGGLMSEEVGWFTKARPTWPAVAVHELGHQAFGLDDEYPYENFDDPPRVFRPGPVDLTAPNVTTVTSIPVMKWGELVTLPQTFVPTTVPGVPCVRDHAVLPAAPPVPADAVGAYEGAACFDCGTYRPSLICKMRDSTDPFCRVCENTCRAEIGHYRVVQGGGMNAPAGSWTHMLSFQRAGFPVMLAYQAATGAYAVSFPNGFHLPDRRPDGTPPIRSHDPAFGTGSIEPDLTWLTPFTLDSVPHFLGQGASGRQCLFRLQSDNTLVKTFDSPPGQASHTHLVTLELDGAPHHIGYNRFTGDAALFRIGAADAAPALVQRMQWGSGHNVVVALQVEGKPVVLTYRIITGEVVLRAITRTGFTTTFASPTDFWTRSITHAAAVSVAGRPYVVRYSALSGRASIHHVRRTADGIDHVTRIDPSPGPGGHTILGVGAPILGRFQSINATPTLSDNVFFYSADNRSLHVSLL